MERRNAFRKYDGINFHQHIWFPIWKTFLHFMRVFRWAFSSSACVKEEEERMYHRSGWGNSPNKIFHGKCNPFLQESKQEPPGPGWAGTHSRPKRKWLRPALGCGGFSEVLMPSSLKPHWHQKPKEMLNREMCSVSQKHRRTETYCTVQQKLVFLLFHVFWSELCVTVYFQLSQFSAVRHLEPHCSVHSSLSVKFFLAILGFYDRQKRGDERKRELKTPQSLPNN